MPEAERGAIVPVAAQWLELEGRTFLVESVEHSAIRDGLSALPFADGPRQPGAPLQAKGPANIHGSRIIPFKKPEPAPLLAKASGSAKVLLSEAKADQDQQPGYVLDYVVARMQ